mgnify:CR=1 FL=1
MKFAATDIAFFITLGLALFVILWMLHGSPTTEIALITIGLFIVSSHVFLWRKYFSFDKNTSISFLHLKHDMQAIKAQLERMDNRLSNVEQGLTHVKKDLTNVKDDTTAIKKIIKINQP